MTPQPASTRILPPIFQQQQGAVSGPKVLFDGAKADVEFHGDAFAIDSIDPAAAKNAGGALPVTSERRINRRQLLTRQKITFGHRVLDAIAFSDRHVAPMRFPIEPPRPVPRPVQREIVRRLEQIRSRIANVRGIDRRYL